MSQKRSERVREKLREIERERFRNALIRSYDENTIGLKKFQHKDSK